MKNNKGFMMAELVVVAAIVLTLMTALYVSYNKIYSAYMARISYYDSTTLYRLAYYRDVLVENNLMNDLLSRTKTAYLTNIYGKDEKVFSLRSNENFDEEDRVLLIYNHRNAINKTALNGQSLHPTFMDYIDFLANSAKLQSNYVLIMERCSVKDNSDVDDCKYAYLEVYDGYE